MTKKQKEKKTINISFIFITILFLIIIGLLNFLKDDYKEMINILLNGSYYHMDEKSFNSEFDELKKKYEFNNIIKIVNVESNVMQAGVDIIIDNNLNDNEIGVPYSLIQNGVDYSDSKIRLLNYEFIKKYGYESKYPILAINENTLNKLGLKYVNAYVFELKDWSNAYDVHVSLCLTSKLGDEVKYISRVKILSKIPLILAIIYIILIVLEILKYKKVNTR